VLYTPEEFVPLTDEPWSAKRVRAAIREIVRDTEDAYDPDALWPAGGWDAWKSPLPLKSFYCGAAGVIWALGALHEHADLRLDHAQAAARTLELWRAEPDYIEWGIPLPSQPASSLLFGESGILLLLPELADDLHARVRENVDNEAEELMWGSPGTMLAARAMHDRTGDERWAEAWHESAEALLGRRDADGLWTQWLYGNEERLLGPAHGLLGNVHALLQVEGEWSKPLRRETAAILAREAIVEDGLANWPAAAGGPLDPPSGIRLQWCHGAPGVVATAAFYVDEELLLAGAELIWRAGAHGDEKGHGLCHGTSGNGFALLKAFERTGDELWLERARCFAVHALEQAHRGGGRYTLFTGDVGAAFFAAACLDADARYPVLDWL
jgi:hypothetical protein